jgi:hypothetical protein
VNLLLCEGKIKNVGAPGLAPLLATNEAIDRHGSVSGWNLSSSNLRVPRAADLVGAPDDESFHNVARRRNRMYNGKHSWAKRIETS